MAAKKKNTSEALPILTNACSHGLPVDVRIADGKSATLYRSRFLSLDQSAEQPLLVIEAPVSQGSVVPLRKGQRIRVSFANDGWERSFLTVVASRGEFWLNSQLSVRALGVLVPEALSEGQRRAFYRISVNETSVLELNLAVLSGKKGKPGRVRAREKATVTDIGGGGLGFNLPEGKSLLLSPATYLRLRFKLPGEDSEIRMTGRICFRMRIPEQRRVHFGVQFSDVDTDEEYGKNLDKILRFVADQERRTLSRRSRPGQ